MEFFVAPMTIGIRREMVSCDWSMSRNLLYLLLQKIPSQNLRVPRKTPGKPGYPMTTQVDPKMKDVPRMTQDDPRCINLKSLHSWFLDHKSLFRN